MGNANNLRRGKLFYTDNESRKCLQTVFGLLVVLLSLGAFEVLPDGRVVMVLGDWEAVVGPREEYVKDTVWVHFLTNHESLAPYEQFEVRFISVKKFINNKLVRWAYENMPAASNWLPFRFQDDICSQIRIGVTMEQEARMVRAMKDGRIVLIAP